MTDETKRPQPCNAPHSPFGGGSVYHCAIEEGHAGEHAPYPGGWLVTHEGLELRKAARRFLDAWGFDHEVGTPREQSDAAYALDCALRKGDAEWEKG